MFQNPPQTSPVQLGGPQFVASQGTGASGNVALQPVYQFTALKPLDGTKLKPLPSPGTKPAEQKTQNSPATSPKQPNNHNTNENSLYRLAELANLNAQAVDLQQSATNVNSNVNSNANGNNGNLISHLLTIGMQNIERYRQALFESAAKNDMKRLDELVNKGMLNGNISTPSPSVTSFPNVYTVISPTMNKLNNFQSFANNSSPAGSAKNVTSQSGVSRTGTTPSYIQTQDQKRSNLVINVQPPTPVKMKQEHKNSTISPNQGKPAQSMLPPGFKLDEAKITQRRSKYAHLINNNITIKLPPFIEKELKNTTGEGKFTVPELLVTLLLAYQYLHDPKCYSKITMCMGRNRTRSSIRRKLEKLVTRKIGEVSTAGGLLHNKQAQKDTGRIIVKEFWKLVSLNHLDITERRKLQAFATQLVDYAIECKFPMYM